MCQYHVDNPGYSVNAIEYFSEEIVQMGHYIFCLSLFIYFGCITPLAYTSCLALDNRTL